MPHIKVVEVATAVIKRDNKFLIAKRKLGGSASGKWEFPGGKIEKGETPEECLTRELSEEFGIVAHIDSFFMASCFDYEEKKIRLLLYFATHVSGKFELHVHDEIRWVSKDELPNYDFANADIPVAVRLAAGV